MPIITTSTLPGAAASDPNSGAPAWSSPESIRADDGVSASVSVSSAQQVSAQIVASSWGVRIPPGSRLRRVSCVIEWKRTGTTTTRDYLVQMWDGSSGFGVDVATGATIGTSADVRSYSWTADLPRWSLAVSDAFGVAAATRFVSGLVSATVEVDVIRDLTIEYEDALRVDRVRRLRRLRR